MTLELIYTSSPQGLKPGSRGYCTVAASAGLSPRAVSVLESLSGYRHAESPTERDVPAAGNPILWSHLLTPNGQSILSRVADAGLDDAGRKNKIAHHRLLDPSERSAAGPSAMIRANPFCQRWEGAPRKLGQTQLVPGSCEPNATDPTNGNAWHAITGDTIGATRLAETVSANQEAYLIFDPSMDLLALVYEAMSLLSPKQRWQTTFCTYTTVLPAGLRCQWRFVLSGSPEARRIPPHNRVLKIDLTRQ